MRLVLTPVSSSDGSSRCSCALAQLDDVAAWRSGPDRRWPSSCYVQRRKICASMATLTRAGRLIFQLKRCLQSSPSRRSASTSPGTACKERTGCPWLLYTAMPGCWQWPSTTVQDLTRATGALPSSIVFLPFLLALTAQMEALDLDLGTGGPDWFPSPAAPWLSHKDTLQKLTGSAGEGKYGAVAIPVCCCFLMVLEASVVLSYLFAAGNGCSTW